MCQIDIQIQSWSEQIASILHNIQSWSQRCGSGCFVNRFRFQQSLDSISSMNLMTSMAIKTSSLRITRAHY